jgi:hypothetical protein
MSYTRRSVPYGFVKKNGLLLMTLRDGEVVFPKLAIETEPARILSGESEPDSQGE